MQEYLDHKLECPYCGTIRLRIPTDATESTEIKCDDCGKTLGTWGELQDDFADQGGHDDIFRLSDKVSGLPYRLVGM